MPSDIQSQINDARSHGYTDDEIVGYLGKSHADLAPKITEAQSSGYKAGEILDHLASAAEKSYPPGVTNKSFYDAAVRGKGPVDTTGDFDFGSLEEGMKNLKVPGQRLHGIHQIISGLSSGVSMPAILGGMLTNPVGTTSALVTGAVGSKAGTALADLAEAGQGGKEIAGDAGSVIGGLLGGIGIPKAGSAASAILDSSPRAAEVMKGTGQLLSSPVVASLKHPIVGAGLALKGAGNIVNALTRELTPYELANQSFKASKNAPVVKPGNAPVPEPHYISDVPENLRAASEPETSTPSSTPTLPPLDTGTNPPLPNGMTASEYFDAVIKPKSGEAHTGFLPGEDAELLNGLARHYEKMDFEKLSPEGRAVIRALANPKKAPSPSGPDPNYDPEAHIAAMKGSIATPDPIPIETPSTLVATPKPTAEDIKAQLAQEMVKSGSATPEMVAPGTELPPANQWPAREVFADSRRPFKAMELAQPLHEIGVTANSLEDLKGVPSTELKAAVKHLGINKTGDISPESLQLTIQELRRMEAAKVIKNIGDLMK